MKLKSIGMPILILSILVIGFQNCGDSRFNTIDGESLSSLKGLSSSLSGNGEGYSGKISGIYATVDVLDQCGQGTTSHLPIREKIEVKDGIAKKTVANCQPVTNPQIVDLSKMQTSSMDGRVLVFGERIFEKAEWAMMDLAPRDQFVNIFCQGKDPISSTTIDAMIYGQVTYIYSGTGVTQVNNGTQSVITSSNGTAVINGSQQVITTPDGTTVINGSQIVSTGPNGTTVINGSQTVVTGSGGLLIPDGVPPEVLQAMSNPLCWDSK